MLDRKEMSCRECRQGLALDTLRDARDNSYKCLGLCMVNLSGPQALAIAPKDSQRISDILR